MPSRNPSEISAGEVLRDKGLAGSSWSQHVQTTYMDPNTPLEALSDLSDLSDDSDEEWENGSDNSDDTSMDHDRGGEEDDDNDEWMNDCEGELQDELRDLAKEYATLIWLSDNY